jgi:hypothetical protein
MMLSLSTARRLAAFSLAATGLLGARTAAAANVCATIDENADTLDEGDRKAAFSVLKQALGANGHTVVTSDCTETYTASNVRLGKTINVSLVSSKGSRNLSASVIEELPAVYDQLVKALDSGKVIGDVGVADRKNVTLTQAAPNRVQSDNLGYVVVGYGLTTGGDAAPGPSLGGGYRYELDRFAVDAGLRLDMAQKGAGAARFGFLVGIRGLYFLNPSESSTPYLGAGFSFGATSTEVSNVTYIGSGIAGRVSAGYEFLRESTIRFIVEADATLPFYRMDRSSDWIDLGQSTAGSPSSVYGAMFGLNLGVAWGSNSNRVSTVRIY